jgi:hypothetical protein
VRRTCLTEACLQETVFFVYEPYYASVSDLKARYCGKKLDQSHFSTHVVNPEDVFVGTSRFHAISFPERMKVGDEIEYQFKTEYDDLAFLPPILVPNRQPLERFEVEFEHPAGTEFAFEFAFPRDSVPCRVSERGAHRTMLTFDSIGYAPHVPYFPFNDLHAGVLVSVFRDGERLTPSTARDFVSWYGGLTDLEPRIDHIEPSIQTRLAGDSDDSTVALVHAFVRDRIRYIGDRREGHRMVPHSPPIVLQRMYGDCKDKAALVCALSRLLGVRVHMALVSTVPRLQFQGAQVGLYNHMICLYEQDGCSTFFDPTARMYPFGSIPATVVQQPALILSGDQPRIAVVPLPDSMPGLSLSIRAHIADLDRCDATAALRHDYRARALAAMHELRGDELRTALAHVLLGSIQKMLLHEARVVDSNSYELVLDLQLDLSQYVIQSRTRLYVPRAPFLTVDRDVISRQEDAHPIYLESPERLTLELHLMSDLSAANDSTSMETPEGFHFMAKMNRTDSVTTTFTYMYVQPHKYLAGTTKEAFIEFGRQVLAARRDLFALEVTDP